MSATSESDAFGQTAHEKPIQFSIEITKSDVEQSIGIRMAPFDDDSFEVTEIVQDGLVDEWNCRQNDDLSISVVKVGDRVIAANDYTGREEIGAVIRSGVDLNLTILRCPSVKRTPIPAMPQMDANSMAQIGKLFEDPNMMKQMSDVMADIPPEQLAQMMQASASMFSGKGGATASNSSSVGASGGSATMPDPTHSASMQQMMNDPKMMKAAEDMMAKLSPETLASIAQASGMKLDENNKKMIARYAPFFKFAVKCMFCCKRARTGVSGKGKYMVAVLAIMLGIAFQTGYI
eukprot:TRINITY_DN104101_c0_g1_i1.p1 TRINITY_DN104101_c0_g1~~TRINITY_DN104101_c0_g1_i1.p1  ORF type:complete len:291 (+),score=61.00 TRINITY_DN104101_c0_g1_i1:155-1027(+)